LRARLWIGVVLGLGTGPAVGCDAPREGPGPLHGGAPEARPPAPGDCRSGGSPRALAHCGDVVAVLDGAGFGSLQGAVDAAPAGSTVWLCPGTFRDSARLADRILRLEAARPGATTLVGDGRLLDVHDSALALRGVDLRGGRSAGPGGAIRSERSDLVVTCATIAESVSSLDGGAISSVDGSLRIVDVAFRDNAARHGGAVRVAGTAGATDWFERSTFDGNRAREAGGAIALESSDGAWIEDCAFDDNEAGRGGAIAARSAAAPGITVVDSRLEGNVADTAGGAILLDHGGAADVSIQDTVIAGGVARSGAALAVTARVEGGVVAFVGGRVDDNRASSDGAAIEVDGAARIRFTGGDLGAGATDNEPADVVVNGEAFDGGDDVDLTLPESD